MTDKNLGITEVVLRDGHQSLLATRFRYEDMEEILSSMDEVDLALLHSRVRGI